MSKSLNLFGGAAVATAVVLTAAHNFADRTVVPLPKQADLIDHEAPSNMDSLFIAAAIAQEVAQEGKFGLGRPALPEEVAAWDLDIAPDGRNLPVGSGDVWTGDEVFAENCAVCHGDFAEGAGNWPKLAGGQDTLDRDDPLKTVGSYWPYLSTTFDYVRRSMPFGNAQSLSDDEVYAITAYILYSNDLVDEDFVLSNETFMDVEMPNANGFIVDDRETAEAHFWTDTPCMENCKDEVKITMKATVLDVTPDEVGEDEAAADAPAAEVQVAAAEEAPAAEQPAADAPAAAPAAAIDMALAEAGEKVFKKCKACHQVGDGAKNRTGPELNGILGRAIGGMDGFKYSKVLSEMGGAWDHDTLAAFLADPKGYAKGTKMSFAGLKKEDDVNAVIEYLKQFQ
ncbi:c-type cytochrome [Pseudoprimorskyibacter insulae]|uniref:Cytochrome c2 n=1 Tax=Pseudoprimorskyibacter insulae TaxID=1695997 RepID=A0A2R8B1I3_9RHOB|nr:c-type cytochrome [Pseudoprimorskyibacter insulae]SPF82054.1 Cytochrome c2 [Pseudoprimorskyibacter insulae]